MSLGPDKTVAQVMLTDDVFSPALVNGAPKHVPCQRIFNVPLNPWNGFHHNSIYFNVDILSVMAVPYLLSDSASL